MRWLLIIVAIIIGLVVIVYMVGMILPRKHVAVVQALIPATSEKVWNRITAVAQFPNWRKDMTTIQIVNDSEWTEVSGRMRIPMKMQEREPMRRMVAVINSKDLPFSGEWVYELQPQGDSTLVTITENGEVGPPIFRFVSKFIMGHTATLNKYVSSLQESFK